MSPENRRSPRGKQSIIVLEGFRSGKSRDELEKELLRPYNHLTAAISYVGGRYITDEERERFEDWRKDSRRTADQSGKKTIERRIQASIEKNAVLALCWPFFLRKFFTDEIAIITSLSERQVTNCRENCKKDELLDKPTPEETAAALKRRRRAEWHGERIYSQDERTALSFARLLQLNDLIPTDLTNWYELDRLSEERQLALPESHALRLRLEVFLVGCKKYFQEGSRTLLEKSSGLGRATDPVWFRETLGPQQKFILDITNRQTRLARLIESGRARVGSEGEIIFQVR